MTCEINRPGAAEGTAGLRTAAGALSAKHAWVLQPFRRVDATANTSSRLQSRGAACQGLFPWKPRSALARNEVGFLVACRAADGEEKRGEANLNVTKMSGSSHIPFDPFPPFRRYFYIRTGRRCETASILRSLGVMVGIFLAFVSC